MTLAVLAGPAFAGGLPSPANVHVSGSTNTSLTLSWNAVAGATNYRVKLNKFESGTTNTSFTFTGLTPCTSYSPGVRATGPSGSGLWSSMMYVSGMTTGCPITTQAPVNTSAPAISGSPQQGQMLSASTGSWSGSPTSYGYQWRDCSSSGCTDISGATASTYTLQSGDVSKSVDAVVTATNAGGTGSATSASTQTVTAPTPPSSGLSPLQVTGNRLTTSSGQVVRLVGTDISGSTYACEQGYGFSDTPMGSSLYGPMVSNAGGVLPHVWPINSVTIGINQDCWLGINGVPAAYSGQNYINYVKSEVASMEKYGIYPVIGFFVGEPGTDTPNWYSTGNGNAPMPDADHVPLVWEEIANEFKGDPNVMFRLYEEPWPDFYGNVNQAWACWSQGDVQYGTGSDSTLPAGWESSPGTQAAPTPSGSLSGCGGAGYPEQSDGNGHSYRSVGMQSLVDIIRGTGASNVIQVPGIAFADALTCTNTGSPVSCGFLQPGVRVIDPLAASNPSLGAQLMADTDNYPDVGQFVNSVASVQATYGPVQQVMPIDMGEAGVEGNPASFPLIQQFIGQYDAWGQSYYLSQWESWANLISSYSGMPYSGCGLTGPGACWGTWIYDHLTGATL